MIRRRYLTLFLILLLHSFILNHLIFFPYPELFIYPYLTDKGLLPYAHIFDQHFPGLLFLPVNFHSLGMLNEIVARRWLISVVLLTQLLLYWIVYKLSGSYKKALFANLLYLIWQPFLEGWVLWIDTFLPLFLLPTFYFSYHSITLEDNKFNLFTVGFLASLLILFKQVTLPLVGALLLVFIIFRIKNLKYFFIGLAPISLVIFWYFNSLGILKNFWFWTIQYNLTTFAKYGGKSPSISGLVRVVGVYSSSFLLVFLKDKRLMVLLVLFLLGSLSGDLARFDFVHFQPSLPFVILITVLSIDKYYKSRWSVLFIIGYLLMMIVWLGTFYTGHLNNKILFFDDQTKLTASKIRHYTKPGEEIYIFGPVPHLYQMSNTIPVGRIFVFQFPWFIMETEDLFLKALTLEKPNLILRDRSVVIEGNPITNFAKNIDQYIDQNYVTFDKVDNTEFMKLRNEK